MLIAALAWLVLCWLLAVGALAVFNLVLVRFIEALVPPLGRFVEIDGLRLHLVDSGEKPGQSGPPLVFFHGCSASSTIFPMRSPRVSPSGESC